MKAATIDHFLQRALEHHQAGRLGEAETLYRAIIELEPDHAGANYQLGRLTIDRRQPVASLPWLRRALENDPQPDAHWLTYAETLHEVGQTEAAQAILALAQARGLQSAACKALLQRLTTPAVSAPPTTPIPSASATSPQQTDAEIPKDPQPSAPDSVQAPLAERQALYGLFQARSFAQAETAARELLQRFPQDAFVWKLLGSALSQNDRPEAALSALQNAVALSPRDPEIHNTLGVIFKNLDRLDESWNCYQQALRLSPDYAEAHYNLGNLLVKLGRESEAEANYHRALAIDPTSYEAHANLGLLLMNAGRLQEAEKSYQQALALKPNLVEAHNNLGNMLDRLGRLGEAEASFRRALDIRPDFAEGFNNLGNVLRAQGRLSEAEQCYRQALVLKPDKKNTYSNLLFACNYGGEHDPLWQREQAQGYERAMFSEDVRQAAREQRFALAPRWGRALRVGVLSADFGQHAVSYFLLSWMRELDPRRVELWLYPTKVRQDSQVERFRSLNVPWIPVQDLSDAEAAERIRTDQIDILIDTGGHTSENRLGIIAYRAAPVQCHYIGYFGTTGLTEMDYFLADTTLIPPELDVQFTEQIWRLPHPWMAYAPLEEAPEPCWRADAGETLWVGSFNNLTKVREDCLILWARVLRALPQAQLLLKDVRSIDPKTQQRIRSVLVREGVDPGRVVFTGKVSSWREHMAQYDRLDIALDPIPMTGGSTAFDTLWMGVPLVTLAGDRLIGRQGAAALAGLGRPEWIARDAEDYVRIVVELARDVEGRRAIRTTQRKQMQQSAIGDGAGMARVLEDAFEQMFDQWWNKQDVLLQQSLSALQTVAIQGSTENTAYKNPSVAARSRKSQLLPADKQQALVQLFNEKRFREAEDSARQLTQHYPQSAFAWKAYGSVLSKLARPEEALEALQNARDCSPNDHEVHNTISVVLNALNRTDEAITACYQSIALNQNYSLAHNNLGNLLKKIGRFTESAESYRRALALDPKYALAHMNLGSVLQELGDLDEAEHHCRQAVLIDPSSAEAHGSLGNFFLNLGQFKEAENCYRQAIALNPELAEAHRNIGTIFHQCGHLSDAEACYRQAIAFKPDFTRAHANLGAVLAELERLPESESSYLKAIELQPDDQATYDSFLFEFAYSGYYPPKIVYARSKDWEFAILSEEEREAARTRRFSLKPRTNRRLRVGVLSADFGQHAVAYFLLSWMRHIDLRRIDLRLYSTKLRYDNKVELFRRLNAPWISVHCLNDIEAAAHIRADELDVLVDTNGHTAGNRLGIIAHRAAPIQCHYIGYFATTGLSEMDYFLADDTLIPPVLEEQFTEKVWRLPHAWMVYEPLEEAPEPRWRADAEQTLWVGSFNNLAKVREGCLVLWAQVLNSLPQARLLLKDARSKDLSMQKRILGVLEREGIGPQRVHFVDKVSSWQEHMAQYERLDIALDPIPMTGGSTAFDTLWMGVPLVTLAGDRLIGRQGAAALMGLGRPEWIARNADDYVRIVVDLAGDLEGRRTIRATQREQMRQSQLCDGVGMARALEDAFEQMFDRWWQEQHFQAS